MIPGAPRAPFPAPFEPQLATLVSQTPDGEDWIHELKFDGYRILARLKDGKAELISRNGKDWTDRLAPIARAVERLRVRSAILDGEAVVLDEKGVSSFTALQQAFSDGRIAGVVFYAFDLLYLDGHDLRGLPLVDRKELLRGALAKGADPGRLRYADHIAGGGEDFYRHACRHALEGIVSKRAKGVYKSGRGPDWLKVKCRNRQEFVIGGFTDPAGSRAGFGSLALGVRAKDGRLTYAGKVGTGFDDRLLVRLRKRLDAMEQEACPFDPAPDRAESRGVHWVRPELVAEIEFGEWTSYGILRHPVFLGLREDKPAERVVQEAPELPVRLTNPDRVLYPEQGITKRGLAEFYLEISKWILPHVVERPLSLVRCPEGQAKPCFYQKHSSPGFPEAIHVMKGAEKWVYVKDLVGLLSLVQVGVLEIHPWGSRTGRIERPDLCVMDFDPAPDVAWSRVVEAALVMRERLRQLDLESFVKTTGGKGLHVVIPLDGRAGWDEMKAFSKILAEEQVRLAPDRFTSTISKAKRTGKIFVDYLRNGRGATAVAAYSTRARPGATAAVPISWAELSKLDRPDPFNVKNLPALLAKRKKDPWEGFFDVRQGVPEGFVKQFGRTA